MEATHYESMTDEELLRMLRYHADPAVRELCRRLELALDDIEMLAESNREFDDKDEEG